MDHDHHAHHAPAASARCTRCTPRHEGGGARDPRPRGARGHDQHAGHSVAMFRDRFWLSVLLTIPVLVWSEMVQGWLGFTAPTFPLSARIPAVLGTVVFVYGGMPFLRGGVREIRDRQPGMMLLISLAILVAFVASLASEFGVLDLEFWWELALLIDVMLLGHWQEMKALGQASGALEALAALLPDEAEMIHGDMTHTVPVAELRPGDLVLVRPGGRVPADGTIVDGDGRVRRVDDHGGVQAGRPRAERSRRGRHGGDRRRGPDPGRGRRGRHDARGDPAPRRWRRRRRVRGRRRSPTAPPRSCSTSRSPPARSRSSCGARSARRARPSSAP